MSTTTTAPVVPDGTPAVEAHALRRRYQGQRRPGRAGRRETQGFEAVRGLDLTVQRGELFALLGTNGAGKTSTLEVLEGLAPATSGQVRVLGHDPFRARDTVRPRIGIMLQEGGFPGALTVREMADLWHRTLDRPRPVGEVLEMVVLGHRADTAIDSLSGGERRRLDLALALLGRPDVLFLDEPTTGLDPESRRATWDLVRGLLDQRTTVLLTTHYLEEAEELADRIAIMSRGVVATEGTLHDIVSRQPSRITFSVVDPADVDELRLVLGAGLSTEPHGGRTGVAIETFEPRTVLELVLRWAGVRCDLTDLQVLPGSLEQAFLDVARTPGATDLTTPVPGGARA